MSRFESLANELLLDVFDYLNSAEILRLFFGLNARFNSLLHHYLHRHALDFRSVRKKDFDLICEDILPSLTEHITRLHLSNDDDTPNEPIRFLNFGFRFDRFSSLHSLSFYSVHSVDLLEEILRFSPRLISLKLIDSMFEGPTDKDKAQRLINLIWTLPELQSCLLENVLSNETLLLPIPEVTSSTLRYCSIKSNAIPFSRFFLFAQRTPRLETLKIKLRDVRGKDFDVFPIRSLTKFTVHYHDSFDHLQLLLTHLPNLIDLTIETSSLYINGDQWEEILPERLDRFQMLMNFHVSSDENLDEKFDEILQSFQSDFWLIERQWFVRCEMKSKERWISVYTLPFPFATYDTTSIDRSKSTCSSNDSMIEESSQVKRLIYNPTLSPFPARFPSIHHLELSSTIDSNLSLVLPRLDRLVSLELNSFLSPDHLDQIHSLLNAAIHLRSLTMDCITLLALSTRSIHHRSIRRLNLIVVDGHFYDSDCFTMIHSLIDDQLEFLLINLEHRQLALDLLEQIPSLRALTFQSQDDRSDELEQTEEDELIQWFRERLPSTFSITRDDHVPSAVRIWIG